MERLTKFDYENYRALKPKQDVVDKLGELEDVLEKYGIEITEELDGVLKPLIDNGELENWKSANFWKMQTERFKKELAELKEQLRSQPAEIVEKIRNICSIEDKCKDGSFVLGINEKDLDNLLKEYQK